MSNISTPLAPSALEYASSASGPVGLDRPFGALPTLLWGAAGIAALMIFWITAHLPNALAWMQLGRYPLLVLLSFGHIATVAVVAAALWSHALPFRSYLALLPLRWRDVGRGVAYGVLGYLALNVAYILYPLIRSALGFGSSLPDVTKLLPSGDGMVFALLSLWIVMVIAAPIAEEILFRGFLYRGLAESRLGPFGAIILTSAAFGLVHYPVFGWMRVIATGFVGLLLGWLRWRTGNTGIGIVVHAVMNLMGVTIMTVVILLS